MLPALIGRESTVEVLHLILDLPLSAALLEHAVGTRGGEGSGQQPRRGSSGCGDCAMIISVACQEGGVGWGGGALVVDLASEV